ncbi:MAG: rhodanese-like domain-containing protein [Rhodobacterales bacterium]|nr:rhodanese-like domain-containing protein [Rhodobacterales bacterium]
MGRTFWAAVAVIISGSLPVVVSAQNVRITSEMLSQEMTLNNEKVVIERIQDTGNLLQGDFTKTSRPCPPFCIHPISAAPGVRTVGELEVIDFLKAEVAEGKGLLIDARLPVMFEKGSIPGAVNIPFSTLNPDNPFRDEILLALGARPAGGDWDYSNAMKLSLFCNGPWCDQSSRAIRYLTAAGYPSEKLSYYRGGMQLWMLLGLTVN